MIQRIQSVYLFLAVVLSVVCLCVKIGMYTAGGMVVLREYNLWTVDADGAYSLASWPLFVVLLLSAAVGVYAIFAYRNRKSQSRLCLFSSLLIVGWYVLYAVYSQFLADASAEAEFTPSLTAVLPFVSMAFYVLARRAILADERLVRAADRIR